MRINPNFSRHSFLLLIAALLTLLIVLHYYYNANIYTTIVSSKSAWSECMNRHLNDYSAKEWGILTNTVAQCSNKTSLKKPTAFTNKDETKFAFLTDTKRESVLITIGVGKDTAAEEKFQKAQPLTQFHGADPITDFNEALYSKFGQFYPFAIGNETKKSTANVLLNGHYVNKQFFHLNIIVFIKYLVKQRYIDHMWFDAEGAEYGIFDMLHRNGDFENENIVICQINMETHLYRPEDKATFMDFVEKLVMEGRYTIVDSYTASHNRLFFANTDSEYCREKFGFVQSA